MSFCIAYSCVLKVVYSKPNLSRELIVTDLNSAAEVLVVPEKITFKPNSIASSLAVVKAKAQELSGNSITLKREVEGEE